ncbi:MAG: hypothetical protein PSV35_00250 [bacterium]|nr:hypothetical protein [bacterium]
MTDFTQFSVWNNEIRDLINRLHKQCKISENVLADWFYKDAILLFHKSQQKAAKQDVTFSLKNYNDMPIHTPSSILGQKLVAFTGISALFTARFLSHASNELKLQVSNVFDLAIMHMVSKYTPFYVIQAEVAARLNQGIKNKLFKTGKDRVEFIKNEYLNYEVTHPHLETQIYDHLLFLKEYEHYIRECKDKVSTITAHSLFSINEQEMTRPLSDKKYVAQNKCVS